MQIGSVRLREHVQGKIAGVDMEHFFSLFDGYGSELASLILVGLVPAAISLAKWYGGYRVERARSKQRIEDLEKQIEILEDYKVLLSDVGYLKKKVKELDETGDKFKEFKAAYEKEELARQEEIRKLIEKAENFHDFQVTFEAYEKARKERTGSFKRPDFVSGSG